MGLPVTKGGLAGTFLSAANFVRLFAKQQQNVQDANPGLSVALTSRGPPIGRHSGRLSHHSREPSKAWVDAQRMVALLAPLGGTCWLPQDTRTIEAE